MRQISILMSLKKQTRKPQMMEEPRPCSFMVGCGEHLGADTGHSAPHRQAPAMNSAKIRL